LGRITSRVSKTTTITKTLEPTMQFRILLKNRAKIWQQAWKNVDTGEIEWSDIPLVKFETLKS
jgi:hypothetical protein